MKKPTTILFLVLIFSLRIAFAQENVQDIIYLKGGIILYGKIIEQVPGQSVKLKGWDGTVYAIKESDIERFEKEKYTPSETGAPMERPPVRKNSFVNVTEVYYAQGMGNVELNYESIKNKDYAAGFNTMNGVQFNDHLSVGVGIGFDKYKYVKNIPVSFNTRITFSKGDASGVLTGAIGYALGVDGNNGGLLLHPQLGFQTYVSDKTALVFNIGMKWQEKEIYDTFPSSNPYYYFERRPTKEKFMYVTISMGLLFR